MSQKEYKVMNDAMTPTAHEAAALREVTPRVDLTRWAPGDSFTVLGL